MLLLTIRWANTYHNHQAQMERPWPAPRTARASGFRGQGPSPAVPFAGLGGSGAGREAFGAPMMPRPPMPDMMAQQTELRERMAADRQRLHQQMEDSQQRMSEQMDAMRQRMDQQMEEMRTRTRAAMPGPEGMGHSPFGGPAGPNAPGGFRAGTP